VVICVERGADCLYNSGPADATAIAKRHNLLRHLYPDWFHLPVLAFPGCPGKEAIKMGVVVVGVFYHMTKYAYYYCICSFWCS